LLLEGSQQICGRHFGSITSVTGEVVFNTGMVGYTKALTDPGSKDRKPLVQCANAGVIPILGAAILLLIAASIASLLPAARAARVDVMQALRSE
jgi:Carbamoyl-phosphate synthase small chain, CPSase domain